MLTELYVYEIINHNIFNTYSNLQRFFFRIVEIFLYFEYIIYILRQNHRSGYDSKNINLFNSCFVISS